MKDFIAWLIIIGLVLLFTLLWVAGLGLYWDSYWHWFAIFFFATVVLMVLGG